MMREDSERFWKLVRLYNVLNMKYPVDRLIFQKARSGVLSFVFVKVDGGR